MFGRCSSGVSIGSLMAIRRVVLASRLARVWFWGVRRRRYDRGRTSCAKPFSLSQTFFAAHSIPLRLHIFPFPEESFLQPQLIHFDSYVATSCISSRIILHSVSHSHPAFMLLTLLYICIDPARTRSSSPFIPTLFVAFSCWLALEKNRNYATFWVDI